MSAPYRDGEDWLIAGDYCEHQSLGHTCQDCRDTVVDVLCAARDAGFSLHRTAPNVSSTAPDWTALSRSVLSPKGES